MKDITEIIHPRHLEPFFLDWEEYKLHLRITTVLEFPNNNFFAYKLSGFATLIDENHNNDNIPPIEDILLSDSHNGKVIDEIDYKLKRKIFKLYGCQEMSLCNEIISGNHNIDNETLIDNIS